MPPPSGSNLTNNASPPAPAKDYPAIDACSLLTSDEIQSVQGEAVHDARADGSSEMGRQVSRCLFTLPTYSNSISLKVMDTMASTGPRDPAQVWKEMFPPEKLKAVETEAGNKRLVPRKIEGLGEEAFWSGSGAMGALHILHGRRIIAISVGGAGDQEIKIQKSSTLARMIMKRLN